MHVKVLVCYLRLHLVVYAGKQCMCHWVKCTCVG